MSICLFVHKTYPDRATNFDCQAAISEIIWFVRGNGSHGRCDEVHLAESQHASKLAQASAFLQKFAYAG